MNEYLQVVMSEFSCMSSSVFYTEELITPPREQSINGLPPDTGYFIRFSNQGILFCVSSIAKTVNMAECPRRDARRELGTNTWSTGGHVPVRIYTTDRDTQQARQEVEQAYKGLSVP